MMLDTLGIEPINLGRDLIGLRGCQEASDHRVAFGSQFLDEVLHGDFQSYFQDAGQVLSRSRQLTMPMGLKVASTTGMQETRCSRNTFTASPSVASGGRVTGLRVMI